MKIILVFVAFYALWWLLRRSFGAQRRPPSGRGSATDEPQTILACAYCGLHLPRDEALPGRGGIFCGEAHRAAFETEHPAA